MFTKYLKCLILSSVVFFICWSCENKSHPSKEFKSINTSRDSKIYQEVCYLPSIIAGELIKHKFFTLCYSEEHEQALWVYYFLKDSQNTTNYNRPFFIEDPKVATQSADWRNYKNSCYDKGHLCPAGDMKFSKEAYEATFYTSNISPQLPDFNAGIWNRLEQKTRYWASQNNGLYVITGPVFEKQPTTIGKENVSVPSYFYKILFKKQHNQFKTIAFLVPHRSSEAPLYQFVTHIDAIEEKTGINFFETLHDDEEERIEQNKDYKDWFF